MSAAAFKARYAAYTLDLAVLAPAALALCWRPLQGMRQAWGLLETEIQLALDRAFAAGHVSLLALAEALRADPAFNAAMTSGRRDRRSAGSASGRGSAVARASRAGPIVA